MTPRKYTFAEALTILEEHVLDTDVHFIYAGTTEYKYGRITLVNSTHASMPAPKLEVDYLDNYPNITDHVAYTLQADKLVWNTAYEGAWLLQDPNGVVVEDAVY